MTLSALILDTFGHAIAVSDLETHKIGLSASENCARIKDLGFTTSKHMKMYGEDFELVSDPYVDGNCTAVRVISVKDPRVRAVRLPVAILVGPRDNFRHPKKVAKPEPIV